MVFMVFMVYLIAKLPSPIGSGGRRSPIGFSHGLITCIPIAGPSAGSTLTTTTSTNTSMERRSPVGMQLQIPPITVSNPSETCAIIEKSMELSAKDFMQAAEQPSVPPEQRKEQRSVMRDLLAFVRKPSKKVTTLMGAASTGVAAAPTTSAASTSRTGRFAAAFSRAEIGSSTPLLRQSTFSTSPAASSRAAKSAVTKQLSDAGFEPKLSFKLLNSKMSLRLRRAQPAATPAPDSARRSSGEEMSDMESSDSKGAVGGGGVGDSSSSGPQFELENVRFDKVGESYIKHDQIREETFEADSPGSPATCAADASAGPGIRHRGTTDTDNDNDDTDAQMDLLKYQLRHMVGSQSSFGLLLDMQHGKSAKSPTSPMATVGTLSATAPTTGVSTATDMQIQCPTFEIMPPSRRSSFDPPRSPYLEHMRSSPCTDTDAELITLNRLDSGGDSFELIDTDRNRESSFESRYPSSSHTSFDISRYQSTSYDDQTSSFEIIDLDAQLQHQHQRGSIDTERSPVAEQLRKSSIEMVDMETFQRSTVEQLQAAAGGRKSSLETHFDYQSPVAGGGGGSGGGSGLSSLLRAKRQVSEPNRGGSPLLVTMKSHHSAPNRARSPLSAQTSSNYSSRDSYESGFEPIHVHSRTPAEAASKQRKHFPLLMRPPATEPLAGGAAPSTGRAFLCTDQRCSSIFEPRPGRSPAVSIASGSQLMPGGPAGHPWPGSSGEFEPPSPRRTASASPKHTFTFRIVLKKVDSSPDAICPTAERRRSRERNERLRRRDSRKKRLMDAGKSF